MDEEVLPLKFPVKLGLSNVPLTVTALNSALPFELILKPAS